MEPFKQAGKTNLSRVLHALAEIPYTCHKKHNSDKCTCSHKYFDSLIKASVTKFSQTKPTVVTNVKPAMIDGFCHKPIHNKDRMMAKIIEHNLSLPIITADTQFCFDTNTMAYAFHCADRFGFTEDFVCFIYGLIDNGIFECTTAKHITYCLYTIPAYSSCKDNDLLPEKMDRLSDNLSLHALINNKLKPELIRL